MSDNKVTYIQSSEHAIIGETQGQSAVLAPGDRVLLNEDAESHKGIKRLIEAGDPSVEHLSLVEVDPKAEKDVAKQEEEMREKAEKIAAEQRNKEAKEAQDEIEERLSAGEEQSPHSDPTDFPPQDLEAQKLARLSGPGQRASTQEDVVEEEGQKSGRRSARGKSGGK